MKNPSRTSALLFSAAAAALAAAGLYAFMYIEAAASASRAVEARDMAAVAKADQASGMDAISLYRSTAADRARIEGFFVPAGDEVSFIKELESIGPASGASVSIASIAADQEDAASSTTGKISASVSVRGSWQAVMKALALAEALPYKLSIDSASLQASGAPIVSGKPGTPPAWSLSFDATAFTLAPSSPVSMP